jgi:hypothetical protein
MSTAGSIKGVLLDGVAFDAAGDADVSFTLGKYVNERIVIVGGTKLKKVARGQDAQNLTLIVDKAGIISLEALQDRNDDFPMSIIDQDSVAWVCKGSIALGEYTTMDTRISVTLQPAGEWTLL